MIQARHFLTSTALGGILAEVRTKDRSPSKSVIVTPKEPEQKHGDYDDETCSTVTPYSTKDMTVEEA